MARRLRRGDGAALFGLLWAASCLFLVALRFCPRESAVSSASPAVKPHIFDPQWTSMDNWVSEGESTLSLVESLPVGDFSLSSDVPQTFEALTRHVRAAKTSIDLSAMYWNLLGEEDRKEFSESEMQKFGADRGRNLLQALKEAALRGLKLRILTAKQSPGQEVVEDKTALPEEVQMLVDAAPQNVAVRCWSGPEWYGSGILHQKIWVFDASHVYVGSANMDWKSLAQVMEMGVIMENVPPTSAVIRDMQKLFETWWMFASPEMLPAKTETYFSEKFQRELQVPAWSMYLPVHKRVEDPFAKAGLESLGNISHQLQTPFSSQSDESTKGNDEALSTMAAQMFVAAAPLAVTAARSRAFDEDALVYTIRSAKEFVSLSVMDFAPFSMYTPGPLHWPALTDALLAGVYSKPGLRVRLLISQWQHTSPQILEALATLKKQADLCRHMHARCSGRLEIKIFRVPGWQNTTTSSSSMKAEWPSYTRVNHAKYIVTDTRANVGTSNMEWGYFYTTAGASVNTNHEPTRRALEKVFERNWNSSYAQPLEKAMADITP